MKNPALPKTVPASSPSESSVPDLGDILDGWVLVELLGQGGYGRVFLAERDGQEVALKVCRDFKEAFRRFKQEIKALIKVSGCSPAIVEFRDFGFAHFRADVALFYFTMTRIYGRSLHQFLEEQGPLSSARAAAMFLPVAEALALIHAEGIIHRDIKPLNLMVQPDGTMVLVDFGASRSLHGTGVTGPGESAPLTRSFAAVEQFNGGRACERTDVFSFLSSLYFALTFDKPHFRLPGSFRPELVRDIGLQALLYRGLLSPQKDRPSALEVADALRLLLPGN